MRPEWCFVDSSHSGSEVVMFSAFAIPRVWFFSTFAVFLVFSFACAESQEAPAVPEPAPAIDPTELSKLVQDAVKQAVPEQPAAPPPVSASEIQQMVKPP